jgi:hypothetical protein
MRGLQNSSRKAAFAATNPLTMVSLSSYGSEAKRCCQTNLVIHGGYPFYFFDLNWEKQLSFIKPSTTKISTVLL